MSLFLKPFLLALACAAGLFAVTVSGKAPSDDRDWVVHLSRTPSVETDGAVTRVSPYRDWTYDAEGAVTEDWLEAAAFDPDEVTRVWFVVEPHPGLSVMAHTLILFEFSDGGLVGLTIEARRETHEKFAPLGGAFRRFELIYVWATPRDLLTRRAVYLDHEVYVYQLALSPGQARAYLGSLIGRTEALSQSPRFYNTLISNCTNELAKSAGLGWRPAFVLTGMADEALFKEGFILGDSFEEAKAAADATALIKGLNGSPEGAFNAALMAELDRR